MKNWDADDVMMIGMFVVTPITVLVGLGIYKITELLVQCGCPA